MGVSAPGCVGVLAAQCIERGGISEAADAGGLAGARSVWALIIGLVGRDRQVNIAWSRGIAGNCAVIHATRSAQRESIGWCTLCWAGFPPPLRCAGMTYAGCVMVWDLWQRLL